MKCLTAGYIDRESGGRYQICRVLSPLLANIVLNELDQSMDKIKSSFEIGKKRTRNKEYDKITKIQSLQKYNPGSPEIKELAIKKYP